MYLAITLSKLNDFESSCSAFDKAITIDNSDCIIFLNYAITLVNNGAKDRAIKVFQKSEEIYKTLEEDDKEAEMEQQ